jgi:L-malate glycosyltransferase
MSDLRVALMGPLDVRELHSQVVGSAPAPRMPTGHGGARNLATQAAAIHRSGVSIVAITTDREIVETTTIRLAEGFDVVVVPARLNGYGRDLHRRERRALARSLDQAKADLVHAHWTYEYALAALATGHRPVVVGMRDWAPAILRFNPHPYNVARVGMQALAVRRADAVMVNSPYLQAKAALLGRRATVIPNGVAEDRFRAGDLAGGASYRILAVNNGFEGRKNGPNLLRAFSMIKRSLPDAELQLVGSGYEPQGRAARWATMQQLADGVAFLGRQPAAEVDRLMDAATLLIHPSLEESFGMVLVEAMARGTPVLGGKASGAVPWVLGEGRYGALCDVTSPEDIANVAVSLLEEPPGLHELAEAGRQHAWRTFRVGAIADQLVRLYQSVLAGTEEVA